MFNVTLLKSSRCPRSACATKDLEALAAYALTAQKVRKPVDLTIDLMGHRRIRELNRRYRGVDRTTDVISFRDDLGPLLPPEAGEGWDEGTALPSPRGRRGHALSHLRRERGFRGDIAINVQQAALQAREIGHPLRREVRLLLIHGILHLLGYTDYEPRPRRRMFRRQNMLLLQWERKRP